MGALTIRSIEAGDDAAVAGVIRAVMPEFGADGPGFALHDAEVDAMSAAYAGAGAAYFVVVDDGVDGGVVVGGGGVAALAGGDGGVCELRKMYLLPRARGRGIGRPLLQRCLEAARALGYRRIYLETLTGMDAAQHLYKDAGFAPIDGPLGCTGHTSCDRFYARDL